MFSIVSMQEVLINLNGSDDLFKLFEGPRSKGRRVSKAVKEKSLQFTVQQVWILPNHIMILTNDFQKLLAFDQVPRLGMNGGEQTDLLSASDDSGGGVLDILCILREQEYVLVLMKSGEIITWSFTKPLYKWNYVSKISLCKCRNSQVTSYVFDEEENVIVWCEKRGSTHCYVFSADLVISDDSTVTLSDPKTLLHNSLPVHIYLYPDGCCFMPVANKPPGLLLFSSTKSDTITVHIWNDSFDDRYIPTTSSDFQSIITTCVSLWINSSTNESKFISVATHPSTKQLVVLQNDLQVYLVDGVSKNQCRGVTYVCTLEVTVEHEVFAKEVIKIFPFQRLLLIVMSDGLINVFEIIGGLFLWKTDTFRNNAPQVWIRRGSLPTIGMWNRSGIWNLRPKPVAEQIKSLQQEEMSTQNGVDDKAIISDVEISVGAFEGQIKKQNKRPKRRIKQGVNRSTEMPTHHIFKILSQWHLSKLSTDIAINVAAHIKDVLRDDTSEEEVDMEEMMSVLDEINDPVLLVVLFADKVLPYILRKRLLDKLGCILELDSSKYIDKDVFAILEEYYNLGKQIDSCYCTNSTYIKIDFSNISIIKEELSKLENGMYNNASVDQTLNQIFRLNDKYFMFTLLSSILPFHLLRDTYFQFDETQPLSGDFKLLFWKALLRFESVIFEKVCLQLWTHSPHLLKCFIEEADKMLSSGLIEDVLALSSMEQLTSRILSFIWTPVKGKKSCLDCQTEEKTRLYCTILQWSDIEEKDETAYEILIDNVLIDDAMEILKKYSSNTQKHYSLFFRMAEFLIGTKTIGCYAEQLKDLIPNQFNIAEVYKVFISQSNGSGGGQIFKSSDKDLTMGMLKPLIEVMLQE